MARVVRRYYDPVTEQFLSVDALVNQTGTPYAYTGGDPVNRSDPSGMCNDVQGVHVYDGACTGVQLDQIRQAAVQALAAGVASSGCSIWEPWASGSCFRQGWDRMPGWAQAIDATLPITLPACFVLCPELSAAGAGIAGAAPAATESLVLGSLAATGLEGVCRLASNLASTPRQKLAWQRAGSVLQKVDISHLLSALAG